MQNKDIQSEMDRDERITRYMKGQMTSQEESKFLDDVESDEELRQDAVTQARLVQGMRQVDDEFIRALKNASESEVHSALRPRKPWLKKSVLWLSMVASIAIILVVGYKGYDYYHTTRLGMRFATAFPIETIVRGESNQVVESELQTLFDNVVERKNLANTTERLSELWQLANQDTYNDYTDYAPYIGWYLAIGYLEDYEKAKCKAILSSLQLLAFENLVLKTNVEFILSNL